MYYLRPSCPDQWSGLHYVPGILYQRNVSVMLPVLHHTRAAPNIRTSEKLVMYICYLLSTFYKFPFVYLTCKQGKHFCQIIKI